MGSLDLLIFVSFSFFVLVATLFPGFGSAGLVRLEGSKALLFLAAVLLAWVRPIDLW